MKTASLATILATISEHGCQVESVWPDGRYTSWWTLARIEVITEDETVAFVSLWDMGYDENPYGVHTLKIVHIASEDWELEVEMVDDKGRWWRVAAIVAGQDVHAERQWKLWQQFAAEHTERLARIDAEVRGNLRCDIETWPE